MHPKCLHPVLAALLLCLSLLSCNRDNGTPSDFIVHVRLPNEPDNLHPMVTKASFAVQIAGQIMLPAAEYDPVTLELSPLLFEAIPEEQPVTEGPHAGGTMYKLKIRPEAKWDNGDPITSSDYLFTLKAAFNPYLNNSGWKNFFQYISEVVPDPADPKAVTIYFDSTYILAKEAITNIIIYPEHVYDPNRIMSKFKFEDLKNETIAKTPERDTLLKQFADAYQSTTFLRDSVQGAGPYEFVSWTTGENIVLRRKTNWWGDDVKDAPLLLKAYPSEIHYHFIPDAATAEAALKSGQVDILSEVPAPDFAAMKSDAKWNEQFQFFTPPILQVYYLELNQRDPVLADKRIRQALAYALDYDGIMTNMLAGFGQRAVGYIHPNRPYINKNLSPLKQDLSKSLSLIKEAGWSDTNGNGIPDKLIDGKREELIIDIKITNKEEGQNLATILKDNAKKAGIEINIVPVDQSQFNQDIRALNFDIAPMRSRTTATYDDLYPVFHSTSTTNRSGFNNPVADSLMTIIRTADTQAERDSGYYELQEVLYNEQPAIYLYAPLERIIISKKIKTITSSRRPGYFENLFEQA